MSSIIQSIKQRTFIPRMLPNQAHDRLPLSQAGSNNEHQILGGLRRRFSSISLRIPSNSSDSSSAAASWAFRRTKSMSSMGEHAGNPIKRWWEWGWSWIMSRKPVFARDLEMNEEEIKLLGGHNRGSWRHVLYKVRSEVRKIIRSDNVGLPQTCN